MQNGFKLAKTLQEFETMENFRKMLKTDNLHYLNKMTNSKPTVYYFDYWLLHAYYTAVILELKIFSMLSAMIGVLIILIIFCDLNVIISSIVNVAS